MVEKGVNFSGHGSFFFFASCIISQQISFRKKLKFVGLLQIVKFLKECQKIRGQI